MKLAVVIAALDEADQVEASVRSALAPDVEVIVVDGGSRDETVARARGAGVRVLEVPPGRGRQLQAGAEASGGEAVVLLHADTKLPPGFAAAVREALADPRVVGGSFALRFDAPDGALRVIEWGAALRRRLFGLPYGDQALFVRRRVLEEIGGVPAVPLLEDLDLVRALRRHGRLAHLAPPVATSARRYLAGGVARTMLRNWAALAAWRLGVDRERIAAWYRR